MLNLPTPVATLQVVTSAAVGIVVHASFLDLGPINQVAYGWQNTIIAGVATTTVVTSPVAGIDRNVKFLSINNPSATPCDVTVRVFDGTNPFAIFGLVTLNQAWSLHYNTDGDGFILYDDLGQIQET